MRQAYDKSTTRLVSCKLNLLIVVYGTKQLSGDIYTIKVVYYFRTARAVHATVTHVRQSFTV